MHPSGTPDDVGKLSHIIPPRRIQDVVLVSGFLLIPWGVYVAYLFLWELSTKLVCPRNPKRTIGLVYYHMKCVMNSRCVQILFDYYYYLS